ncbi:hypothetical protein BJ742DRAFT_775179 [Cladochytrium replicatum]|nr:hypothetical protein BJ742DRAFT_775179 [Cladochytrium replicatum]
MGLDENNVVSPPVVIRPRTTAEVFAILAYCTSTQIAVVQQGGNTGPVRGSPPAFDEVVLNLGRMDSIRGFDEVSGIVVADSGVVLEKLGGWLAEGGFMSPLDLGAKGSCHIGGNVATNAGGLCLLRYGSLHGTVLGLEAVLPDGTTLDNLSTLRKQLFIGSEGTIGAVTAVYILTPPRAKSTNVALLALSSFAFEFWDGAALDLARNTLHHVRFPDEISGDSNSQVPFFWVLVETQGSEQSHDLEKLERFLDLVMSGSAESGPVVLDWLVAQDAAQATNSLLRPLTARKYLLESNRTSMNGHRNIEDRSPRNMEHGLALMKRDFVGYSKSPAMLQLMKRFKDMIDPKGIMNPYKYLP